MSWKGVVVSSKIDALGELENAAHYGLISGSVHDELKVKVLELTLVAGNHIRVGVDGVSLVEPVIEVPAVVATPTVPAKK